MTTALADTLLVHRCARSFLCGRCQGNTFGNFFQQYATFQSRARTRKPLLISEFGSDALDFRMDAKGEAAVNQSMQARSAAERKR